MPKPADFRAPIRAELGRRRREVFKLLVARTRAEEEEREETERTGKYRSELTTKEREEFDRKVEKLLAEVRAAAAAPV